MKPEICALILLCVIISGCMESPKTVAPPATIPSPYYAKVDPWLDHSIFGIETLIGSGILRKYDADVFDCSEMAAYLEWMLESRVLIAKSASRINLQTEAYLMPGLR